jgi:hypothetical protein
MEATGGCGEVDVPWATDAAGAFTEDPAAGSADGAGDCGEAATAGSADAAGAFSEDVAAGSTDGAGDCEEAATAGSADAAGDCGEVAGDGSTCMTADCHRDDAERENGGLCTAERLKYQRTKAPCKSARTINNHTMDTSTPGGTGIQPMRLTALALRFSRTTAFIGNKEEGAASSRYGSRRVELNAAAGVRMPENLPPQPRQYLARSLFGVWQDSQNFVIASSDSFLGRTRLPHGGSSRANRRGCVALPASSRGHDKRGYGTGMNFVTTTSELITSQKAAKSNAHARCGMTRGCLGCNTVSPECLAA